MDAVVSLPIEGRSRDEWRARWFALIDAAAQMLEREAPIADTQRKLTPPLLDFLRDQDLLRLKLPRELGGAEADNALQFEVYEKLAYHNAAAAWCCFIYTDILALLSSVLPAAGVNRLFASGLPLICGGGGRVMGTFVPAPGGYRVSGRFAYGSGLHGSDWTTVMAVDPANAAPPMMFAVPTAAARSLDNWNVLGLQGTGSADFVIEDAFVPDTLAFVLGAPPVRGGANFRLGVAGLIGHTVPAVALGVARRSLDDLVTLAREKQRGYVARQTIGSRAAFQAFIATADLRLKAARALMLENGLRLAEVAATGDTAEVEAEVRAAGTWATEQAVQISSDIIRWAGGEAVRQGSRFERAMRDIHVASTHYCISNTSFESHGQYLLGMADIPPEA
ncbi:MAG: hypothetical protein C0489_11240 [Candidatus Accumulibacter sp.]|nr:hypothetical protein [Accumulibacter sp.]